MEQTRITSSVVTSSPALAGLVCDVEIAGEDVGLDLSDPQRSYSSRQIGAKGEELAARYLQSKGVEILAGKLA